MKPLDKKTAEELRQTVNSVLASLTPREARLLKMKFDMRSNAPVQEELELRALLKERWR